MMRPQRVVRLIDMLTAVSANFMVAIANVTQMGDMLYRANEANGKSTKQLKPHQFDAIVQGITEIERIAIELKLDATLAAATDCLEICGRTTTRTSVPTLSSADAERLMWSLFTLQKSVLSQCYSRVFFVINNGHSDFLTSDVPPFGQNVFDAFPNAADDIIEASKCLALNRSTAVVFHLMRAMETMVQKLASRLGIVMVDKEWGKLLAEIKPKIEEMPKGQKRNNYSEIFVYLYHVKNAWRNDTMHPKSTYTEEQAEEVFNAVRSFAANFAVLYLA